MLGKELDDMLNLGVIAPVDRPTDWVNSIVLSENKTDKGEVTRAQSLLRPPWPQQMGQKGTLLS